MNQTISKNLNLYEVRKLSPNAIEITGTGKSKAWQTANTIADFSYPWNTETPPLTIFKALWDGEHLYFNFNVEDSNIIINKSAVDQNAQVMESDRVELFFKSDKELINPYYCLEMDSNARVLSSKSRYYRVHQYSFIWPGENSIIVKSSLTNNGYIVEGSISIDALKSLNLLHDNSINTGIYRANFIQNKKELEPKWISWVMPKSIKPDFHIPSSFGIFKLIE